MEGTAVQRRLTWQVATVAATTRETPTVRTIELTVPEWPGHRAGQHLDVRLTAEDGYVAAREYSIASAPGEPVLITVERLDDGEVSPYLTEELRVGDALELRGPVGGYFVWEEADGGRCCSSPAAPALPRCGPSSASTSAAAATPRYACSTRRARCRTLSTAPSLTRTRTTSRSATR